jgi:hypothetical protein
MKNINPKTTPTAGRIPSRVNPKAVADLTTETVLGRPGPMKNIPAYLEARAARKAPDQTTLPRVPIFPAITQEFVKYLKDIDASPELIAVAQRLVDKAKAEANPQKKTSRWARLRGQG